MAIPAFFKARNEPLLITRVLHQMMQLVIHVDLPPLTKPFAKRTIHSIVPNLDNQPLTLASC